MNTTIRRLIAIALVIATISILSISAFAKDFSDVKPGKWYYAHVMYCQERGIVSGYTNGTFKPNNNITRAEFCVMLNKVAEQLNLKKKTITDASSCKQYEKQYTDYKSNKWYSIAVANCLANGFISGTSKSTLSLNKNILRQDVAVMIDKMFGWTFAPNTHQGGLCNNEYTGNNTLRYWLHAMYRFIDLGIYQGDSKVDPSKSSPYKNNYPITRAEMCAVFRFILENLNWIYAREHTYYKVDPEGEFFFYKKTDVDAYQKWFRSIPNDANLREAFRKISKPVKIDSVTINVLVFSSSSEYATSTDIGYATESSIHYY